LAYGLGYNTICLTIKDLIESLTLQQVSTNDFTICMSNIELLLRIPTVTIYEEDMKKIEGGSE